MDKAVLLISQYCDNDLSPEEEVEFVTWLKNDSANIDRFVRASHWHSLTLDVIQEHRLQSSAWSHTLQDSGPYVRDTQIAGLPLSQRVTRNMWMLAIAAL